MSLTDLEQAAFSHFVATAANDINIAGRWFPRSDLDLIIEDKFQIAMRKFGPKARGATKRAAAAFVEHMIAKGGWATKPNDYGGAMHQFQLDAFRAELKALQAADPLVQAGAGAGPEFWADKFAALTA